MRPLLDSSASSHNGSNGSSLTFNMTIGTLGANGRIFVAAGGEVTSAGSTNQLVTGITFNGVAMTQSGGSGQGWNSSANSVELSMWELSGSSVPAAGTYSVVITYNGTCQARTGICLSFLNLKPVSAEAIAGTQGDGTNPIATSITTLSPAALLLTGYVSQNDNAASYTTGETVVRPTLGAGEGMGLALGYRIVNSPGATSVSITPGNPQSEAIRTISYVSAPDNGGALFPLLF